MNYAQAINEKENAEKEALYKEFGNNKEIMDRIDAAFESGKERWKPIMTAVFGRLQAEAFFSLLNKEVDPAESMTPVPEKCRGPIIFTIQKGG
jgi:hypothetical protein